MEIQSEMQTEDQPDIENVDPQPQRNLLLTLSYRGSAYHGFQVQKNGLTIAEVLQNAMKKIMKERGEIKGCSRTDAGVHANRCCVSVKTSCMTSCEKLIRGLNSKLPVDIAVRDCIEVPMEFHARYNCRGKRYIYKIHNAKARSPFLNKMALHINYPLDVEKLNQACSAWVGTHDFSAFCAKRTTIEDKTRTIYSCGVVKDGEEVTFFVEGDGFLYNMVRIMVGTLLEVSTGNIDSESIPEILESKDRHKSGYTAPACGLYLDKIFYDPADLELQESEEETEEESEETV